MPRVTALLALGMTGCMTAPAAATPLELTIMSDASMRLGEVEVDCDELRGLPAGTALLVQAAPTTTYAKFNEAWTCVQSLNLPVSLVGEDTEQS